MKKSEVFEEFCKIAQEKGMMSFDQTAAKNKKTLEDNPRADSLDLSAIEALYGVKPDAPKEMQYERNIIEDAHPNAIVLSPAHDKLNGLVENENERQNITLHILNKTPDGLLNSKKYAEQQLLLSLVRLGNHLDNQDKKELMSLADVCLTQLSMKKTAFPWLLIGGVAALIGALYAHQHLPDVNEGFKQNHQDLISEIDDLISSESHWYGTGMDLAPQLKQDMENFKDNLMKFYDVYEQVEPVLMEAKRPSTANELIEMAKQPEGQEMVQAYRKLRVLADRMLPLINQVEKNFKSETYKNIVTQDKGWLEKLVDKTEILHGGGGLIADDFDDVVNALAAYKKSQVDILKTLQQAESIEKDAQKQLQDAALASQQEFGPAEIKPEEGSTFAGSPTQDLDKQVEDLDKELGNI